MKSALLILIAHYFIVGTLRCDENKTENAKKQELGGNVELLHLPTTISVDEAIKYLEKSKETNPAESVALIKELRLVMATFNVTKLVLDSPSTPANVSGVTAAGAGAGSPANIEREGFLNKHRDGYVALKHAIITHWSFTTTVPTEIQDARDFEDNVKKGYEFKKVFLEKYNLTVDTST